MKHLTMKRLLPILLLAATAVPALAQERLEGRYELREGGLQLELRQGRSQTSFRIRRDELRDLGGGRYELRRDAGTFALDGGGRFVFTPSPDFVRELERRGYGAPAPRELFELASFDLGLKYLDEMEALGYGGDLRLLGEFKIHGVNAAEIREFAALGYKDLPGRRLVEMRIHGVRPAYVRDLTSAGLHEELSTEQLVEMRIHGVKPEYVRDLAAAGLDELSARSLVEMRIHGVEPEWVRDLASLGLDDLSARQLIEMRIHGVRSEDVREFAALGLDGLSARELVDMRIHGVTPSFVREVVDQGYTDLSARRLVDMRIHGEPRRRGRS